MQRWHALRSLRWRLLLGTLVALLLALVLAGFVLHRLFAEHVTQQFARDLTTQLDQITAQLEFDEQGQPAIDPQDLSDPRWSRSFSGLYWQLDRLPAQGQPTAGVLRSRSLWDFTLAVPPATTDGVVQAHVAGPQEQDVLVVARIIRSETDANLRWRLLVAADTYPTHEAVEHFSGLLAGSLGVVFALLVVAGWAQVQIGLAPLKLLQQALQRLRTGEATQLQGRFPLEVQPLVDDFNSVLERNAEIVQRARTQAGNLAHAVKTPLAVLQQAAFAASSRPETQALGQLINEQITLARRQVDWHMARSRAAAAGTPGQHSSLTATVHGLLRAMRHVHAEKHLALHFDPPADLPNFAGEAQDLHELLGNLVDNACIWAQSRVEIQGMATVANGKPALHITIDDDGPGIAPQRRASAIQRGVRLDEHQPGAGLGLSIAAELTALYQGEIGLDTSPQGGLRVWLLLPAL